MIGNQKLINIMATVAISIATVFAVYGTYFLELSSSVKALVWIGWLVVTLAIGIFTTKGKELLDFAKESKVELLKVVWPSKQETVQTTSIVMIMVAITGFVLWGIDSGMMWIIGKITRLG